MRESTFITEKLLIVPLTEQGFSLLSFSTTGEPLWVMSARSEVREQPVSTMRVIGSLASFALARIWASPSWPMERS